MSSMFQIANMKRKLFALINNFLLLLKAAWRESFFTPKNLKNFLIQLSLLAFTHMQAVILINILKNFNFKVKTY